MQLLSTWPLYILVFLFGLIIGSFINCLVYRLHSSKSFIHGRSFCPKCKHKLAWYDNIPIISWLILRAKCRYCQKPISIQYPLVEVITGLLFLLVFIATFNFQLSTFNCLLIIRNLIFVSILIIIFIYDFKYYLILDKITIPAIIFALVINIIINFTSGKLQIANYLLAAVVCSGFFLLQFLISKGRWIGGGDIRLGFLIGTMLGWPNALIALFISYILGSVIGIGLIIAKQKNMQSQVPFGAFLAVGTFIAMLWGDKLLDWYLNAIF